MSATRQSCLFVLSSAIEGINEQNILDQWAQASNGLAVGLTGGEV